MSAARSFRYLSSRSVSVFTIAVKAIGFCRHSLTINRSATNRVIFISTIGRYSFSVRRNEKDLDRALDKAYLSGSGRIVLSVFLPLLLVRCERRESVGSDEMIGLMFGCARSGAAVTAPASSLLLPTIRRWKETKYQSKPAL